MDYKQTARYRTAMVVAGIGGVLVLIKVAQRLLDFELGAASFLVQPAVMVAFLMVGLVLAMRARRLAPGAEDTEEDSEEDADEP